MKQAPEHNLQVAIVQYLRINHVFCFAIPNGGRRDAATGSMLKKEGVLAGVADLEIIMPNRVIFVELKNGKAGRQSGEQKWFEREVKCRGIEYYVWRSMDDCVAFVNEDLDCGNNNGSAACSPAQKALPPFKDIKE